MTTLSHSDGRLGDHKTSFTPPLFVNVTVPSQGFHVLVYSGIDIAHFYYVCVRFWNCFDIL